jgi:uncharacterized protein (DUF4415 family)
MRANKKSTAHTFKSDFVKVDAHIVQPHEYDELPELTAEMFSRAVFKKAGRPVATDPRLQVTIRLPASALSSWKASGAGWQSRMAELLVRRAPKAA